MFYIQQGSGREGFKASREAARRQDAGNRATWNSLFMRQDTVAEAVAAHYGVTKARPYALTARALSPETPENTVVAACVRV